MNNETSLEEVYARDELISLNTVLVEIIGRSTAQGFYESVKGEVSIGKE